MSIHIYLSPHLDDAALSCGGRIRAQVAAGEPARVVNVFAGRPDYSRLSPYAQRQHDRWGLTEDVVARRRAEDQAVLTALGAEIENWDYVDAIYRQERGQFLYTNHDELFGRVNPAENFLITRLALRLSQVRQFNPDAVFYAPLGVGGHVDHKIVRAGAVALAGLGSPVLFYEDFPYVAKQPDAVEAALAEVPVDWAPELIPIDVEAKIEAIQGYSSQLAAVFGDPAAVAPMTRGYATSLAADTPGAYERYWRIV